jgi:RNA polymerase sigma-70 factor (ECF subfamily)
LGLESYEIRLDKPFRTWLFTIARYRVIDHLRKHGRVDVTAPDDMHGLGPQASASHEESLDWISDGEMLLFVERLPLPQRQVLILRHLVGLRTSEIADVLDRTQDSVRQLDSRARSFLATRLAAVGHRPESLQRDASERPLRQAVVLRRRRFALGTQRAGLR